MDDLTRAVEEARFLVGAIQRRDTKTSGRLWELADLTAANTLEGKGRPSGNAPKLSISEWADQIGWVAQGNNLSTLKKMRDEARAWPENRRDENRTFWQHYEARSAHGGDIDAARTWLKSRTKKANITQQARTISEITGSGPVYEAAQEIIKARKAVRRVPAKLAKSNILGNEENFPYLTREIKRLRDALAFLDRYLADEMVVDRDELDEELDRILSGEPT